MALQGGDFQLVAVERCLHDADHGVDACECQFGAEGAELQPRHARLADGLVVQHLHLGRHQHGERLAPEVLADGPVHWALGVLDLLFLLGRVLETSWRSTVSARLDLLVKRHRHICLRQLRRQLPHSSFVYFS